MRRKIQAKVSSVLSYHQVNYKQIIEVEKRVLTYKKERIKHQLSRY